MKKRKTVKNHHGQRGTCGNIGCNEPRQTISISESGIPTYRSVCQYCHEVNYGKLDKTGQPLEYKPGVKRVKKNHCQNRYGTAKRCDGIMCKTKHRPDGTLRSSLLHQDEIDGNHDNNTPENTQTLCGQCHLEKTMLNNDQSRGGNEFIGFNKLKKISVLIEEFTPKQHNFF